MADLYGWYITKDYYADEERDDAGTAGPGGISDALITALQQDRLPEGYERETFRMYDDDGELIYRGRMFFGPETEGTEDELAAPLDQFGRPNFGCTMICWDGHPAWDIG